MRSRRGAVISMAVLGAAACIQLPLAAASAPRPVPGKLYVGRPKGFGPSDAMHWRVSNNGKAMRLVGWFSWSYGCQIVGNYGIADKKTIKSIRGGDTAFFPAPAVFIKGNTFFGSDEDQQTYRGHTTRYGRFTISGTFTSASTADGAVSFADPPHCGKFTKHFKLKAR